MSESHENLPIIVAELIKRMSSDEKKILMSNLDSSTLQEIKRLPKQQATYAEPEVYVRVSTDYVSLEIPEKKIIEFILHLSGFLKLKQVKIRFSKNGSVHEDEVSSANLPQRLRQINEILIHGVVTMEFGVHTLFSTGGGCVLFETTLSSKEKKKLALEFLKLCGYPTQVKSNRFSIGVINGKIKAYEE